MLAAAARCGLPAMASNQALEQALVVERGSGQTERLSNHAHTAAGALQLIDQIRKGHSPEPFLL